MGLFGGAAKTKTTVRPAWQTEQLLKDVVNRSNQNAQNQQFIGHQMAGLTQDQKGALAELSASPEMRQAAGLLQGRTGAGLENLSASNQALRNVINNPITAQQVNAFRSSMTAPSSLSGTALRQGTSAGNAVRGLGGSAALRSAGRFNTSNINALTQNQRSQQMAGLGASTGMGDQSYAQNVAQLQSGLGRTNLNLGQQGLQLGQQATQNQLGAGNYLQQFQQAQNQNNWQNAMGSQMFDWNRVNNQLNVLNQVSPMAGYTATGAQAAPSMGSQLFGAGLSALGTYGKLGGFQGFGAQNNQGEYKNQWYNTGGTGAFNTIGNWFGGAS